jgi:tRNA 2-thiouridine synthesizing protein A
MTVPPERELSCRGMRCPLPVIYTRKALAAMAPGQLLRVVASDPDSMDDIVEFSRRCGAELISTHSAGGDCVVVLRKP